MKLDHAAAARVKALLQDQVKPLVFLDDDVFIHIRHGIVLLAREKDITVEQEVSRWVPLILKLEAKWHGGLQSALRQHAERVESAPASPPTSPKVLRTNFS